MKPKIDWRKVFELAERQRDSMGLYFYNQAIKKEIERQLEEQNDN